MVISVTVQLQYMPTDMHIHTCVLPLAMVISTTVNDNISPQTCITLYLLP